MIFFSSLEYLLTLLWNLYQFYSQFNDMIYEEIQRLRSPIEKKLKVNEGNELILTQ